MLIGLNKDWTFKYVPIGLLTISKAGPSISGRNRTLEDDIHSFARSMAASSSNKVNSKGNSDITVNNRGYYRESTVKSKKLLGNGVIKELNIVVYPHEKLVPFWKYSIGDVYYTVNDFYGDRPSIQLFWTKDVVSVQFGKNQIFDLTKYESPHTFSLYYYTHLGNNELPIKATNKYGNSSTSKIEFRMTSVDNGTTINIENNIYDSPNSTINNDIYIDK